MSKSKIKQFIDYLVEQVKNHSIYVWGAQGEGNSVITEDWIRNKENSLANANRAIAYWKKQCSAGYKEKLRAFDCSGLVVCYLLENGYIKADMNAAGIYEKCKKVTKGDLKEGDLVFRHNGTRVHHIGVYIGSDMVIHSKGRDSGVTREHIDINGEGYWNRFGRYEALQDQGGDQTMASIIIKKTSPLMKGDSIKQLQTALNALGYECGTPDGVAGDKTVNAVHDFAVAHVDPVPILPGELEITVKTNSKTYKGTVK